MAHDEAEKRRQRLGKLALYVFGADNPDIAHNRIGRAEHSLTLLNELLSRASETNNERADSLRLQLSMKAHGFGQQRRRRGRPRKIEDQVKVWLSYHRMNEPTFGRVATEVFPSEFEDDPKKASDKARQLFRSFEKLVPTLESVLKERAADF